MGHVLIPNIQHRENEALQSTHENHFDVLQISYTQHILPYIPRGEARDRDQPRNAGEYYDLMRTYSTPA